MVHRMPQRVRIKIPRWERQDDNFAALRRALERCPGVVSVRVNALAASVVIHCGDEFGPWARQIAPARRIHDHSTRAISLVGLVVKLTIAIATRRPYALITELILEAAVQALVRQLYRKLIQSPRLETPPLLVPAIG